MATASAINTPAIIAAQNVRLGHPTFGSTAYWLSGEDIILLATAGNPDPPSPHHEPAWLSGPGPINFWHTHFARTLTDVRDQGRVHIMVVNTEAAYSLTATDVGLHWFVAAWYVEPAGDNAAS